MTRLRLYAVTGRSKLHASALCVLILAQLASGLWFTIMAWINPSKPLTHLLVFAQGSHVGG